jgi:glycosyltransferase involved in cell wall biosynthesis
MRGMKRLVLLTEIIAPYRIPVFNALARRSEIDLHVIFFAETDSTLRQWLVHKEEIKFSYQVLPSWRRRVGKFHVLLNFGLGAALRHWSPDVIICGGYNYLASWQALWWARRKRLPFVAWVESTIRDHRENHTLVESLKVTFLNRCDAFVVAGKSSTEYVKSFEPRSDRVYLAPDAVDTELFAQRAGAVRNDAAMHRKTLGLPERFFLFVGRLIAGKGVFDLLEAYRTLSPEVRSEVGLVFVGNGVARPELERRAVDISPGSIHFIGFAQRDELAGYYALAETFVFPTHSDPWGLVVNEAMACSLPIICSSAAGCAEDLVTHDWNGRLVPAHEVARLASAMLDLARDEKMRLKMGTRSRQRIDQYSPEICADGLAAAALGAGVFRHA